nr:50S ribosomal protein L11 methyltransferase [Clostridia bacterium]
MEYTELTVSVPARAYDDAEAVICMAAPYGFYAEDYRDLEREVREIANIDLIDDALLAKDRNVCIFHVFALEEDNPGEIGAFISERLKACGVDFELKTGVSESEDWLNGWKKHFHPI